MKRFFIFFIPVILLFACEPDQATQKIQFIGEAQGTYYAVTYFAADTLVSQSEIDSLLRAFDLSASVWVDQSVISRINRNEPGVVPDRHFIEIFKIAQRISEDTEGAFDITVGPLVNAWGFGFKNRQNMNQRIVDSLLPLVGYRKVTLSDGKISKSNTDIQIDYNAIAQGYSVDLLGGFLESRGISNYLVDIGGEVLAKGTKPGDSPWVVGIEKPAAEATSERELRATIEISNRAVATSGNYRKFYEVDGMKYSHTIDPKTGYPVQHSLLSATVVSDSATIADAYATAFMVMGLEKALEFLERHPDMEAYFIYSNSAGNYQSHVTPNLKEQITER
ncbi:MAG: FAD:protein FMN transferase [Bacteroidales bacterium]